MVRYHFTNRMAIIKKKRQSFLKKLKLELPCDLAILLLNIYSKKMKMLIQNDMCTPMFPAALLAVDDM